MRLFLFDIDGTLIWPGGAGSRALQMAFAELFGIEGAMALVTCDGKTDPLIVREVLGPRGLDSPENIRRVLDAYIALLRRTLAVSAGYRVMPGAAESLALLEKRKIPCGLATGNVEPGARAKLERAGLNRFFAFGGFGSDAEERALVVGRAIERGRELVGDPRASAVVIGDTPRDVAAAHSAGALAVGVAAANFDRRELERGGADLVLDDLTRPEVWVPQAENLG